MLHVSKTYLLKITPNMYDFLRFKKICLVEKWWTSSRPISFPIFPINKIYTYIRADGQTRQQKLELVENKPMAFYWLILKSGDKNQEENNLYELRASWEPDGRTLR